MSFQGWVVPLGDRLPRRQNLFHALLFHVVFCCISHGRNSVFGACVYAAQSGTYTDSSNFRFGHQHFFNFQRHFECFHHPKDVAFPSWSQQIKKISTDWLQLFVDISGVNSTKIERPLSVLGVIRLHLISTRRSFASKGERCRWRIAKPKLEFEGDVRNGIAATSQGFCSLVPSMDRISSCVGRFEDSHLLWFRRMNVFHAVMRGCSWGK